MRRFIRQIHLYLGILVSPYLIIYGISSIVYNHRARVDMSSRPGPTIEQTLDMPAARAAAPEYRNPVIPPYFGHPQPTFVEDLALALAARDQLGLFGNVVQWEIHRDSPTLLHFNVDRPARRDAIALDETAAHAKITQQSKGLWSVFIGLHGFYRIPNSAFVSSWGVYTEATTWVVFFFIVTGVYLWFARRTDRIGGFLAFATGLALSAVILLYAWIGG